MSDDGRHRDAAERAERDWRKLKAENARQKKTLALQQELIREQHIQALDAYLLRRIRNVRHFHDDVSLGMVLRSDLRIDWGKVDLHLRVLLQAEPYLAVSPAGEGPFAVES